MGLGDAQKMPIVSDYCAELEEELSVKWLVLEVVRGQR